MLIKNETCNKYVKQIAVNILEKNKEIDFKKYIKKYIELESIIKKYQYLNSIKLFEHQKEVISVCNNKKSKLVLYQAPTGTGKTLSPIGLVKSHKSNFCMCCETHWITVGQVLYFSGNPNCGSFWL